MPVFKLTLARQLCTRFLGSGSDDTRPSCHARMPTLTRTSQPLSYNNLSQNISARDSCKGYDYWFFFQRSSSSSIRWKKPDSAWERLLMTSFAWESRLMTSRTVTYQFIEMDYFSLRFHRMCELHKSLVTFTCVGKIYFSGAGEGVSRRRRRKKEMEGDFLIHVTFKNKRRKR